MSETGKFIVRSEDDLFEIIEKVQSGEEIQSGDVVFEGWPKYEITIKGEDFAGGVPTRIMPALLRLQKSIDEAYAISVHGKQRRLTKEERQKTEIVVYLKKGSTSFEAQLWEILNNALQTVATSMTGEQALIAILGTAGFAGSSWAFKAWLDARSNDKKLELDLRTTEQETERYRILADLASNNQQLAGAKASLEETNEALIKRLDNEDTLLLANEPVVSGREGKALIRKVPEEPIEVRLDGNYTILSVQSGSVKSGFKATIKSSDTGENISLDIPEGTLSDEQLKSLKDGEWAKKPLFMEINAQKRNDKILKATLSHAGLKPEAKNR